MSAREELAAVLAEVIEAHARRADLMLLTHATWAAEATRSLLASPALADLIREKQAEAWDKGVLEGATRHLYRRRPKRPNPYRDGGA